jgi:hypothetical protein
LWRVEKKDDDLTFIDLIKGIIPLQFFNNINDLVKDKKITKKIIYDFRDRFFSLILDEWNIRCDFVAEEDKSLGINKKIKHIMKGKECFYINRVESDIDKFKDSIGLVNNIRFGFDTLGFII